MFRQKKVYRGQEIVWDEETDKCHWIMIQDRLSKMESTLMQLENDNDIKLIRRSPIDYNSRLQYPDVIINTECGIFIHEDPGVDLLLPLRQFVMNYSLFKTLWFLFIENCPELYNICLGIEAMSSGNDHQYTEHGDVI